MENRWQYGHCGEEFPKKYEEMLTKRQKKNCTTEDNSTILYIENIRTWLFKDIMFILI